MSLPSTIFQPPLPPLFNLLPPLSPIQWLPRLVLLAYTILITFPLILIFVPFSVAASLSASTRHLVILPLHPDNLPPNKSIGVSMLRGWWVYMLSGIVWSITSLGSPPPSPEWMTRGIVRTVMGLMEGAARAMDWCKGKSGEGRLRLREARIPVLDEKYAIGVVQPVEGERLGFWLTNESRAPTPKRVGQARPVYKRHRTLSSEEEDLEDSDTDTDVSDEPKAAPAPLLSRVRSANRNRRVYLFLVGGGYVTGWPLVHPFIFSLARTFDPSPVTSHNHLPRQAVFAPDIRKSLSFQDAFPTPLVDAIAAYVHLLNIGYSPEEIVLMGDSAGGGLVWSLLAYLCIASQEGKVKPPGGIIMVSPWLSLPPTTPTEMPDFLDEPQLLNAARSYLARFPILPARPDPFSSEWSIWTTAISRKLATMTSSVREKGVLQRVAQAELHPQSAPPSKHRALAKWLDPTTFEHFTSHHPLLSPCSDPTSPFVGDVLAIAARHTRMLIVSGTAEWFHAPAQRMASVAAAAGVAVEVMEELGGFHCESCLFLAEWDGPGRRLVDTIRHWSL